MKNLFRRPDGSFVAEVNSLPYHIVEGDPLFDKARKAGRSAPMEPEAAPLEADPVAEAQTEVPFEQFLIGLVERKWITEAEGEAWLSGTLPNAVLSVIASMPADQRFAAKARAIRPTKVLRDDPLVTWLAAAKRKSKDQFDTFFAVYSQA